MGPREAKAIQNAGKGILRDVEDNFPDFLHDESRLKGVPDSISFPTTEQEVVDQLASLRESKTPVTILGARTGLVGAAVVPGGHGMSMLKMGRLLGLSRDRQGDGFLLRLQSGAFMRGGVWEACLQYKIDSQGWSKDSLAALEEFKANGPWFFQPDPSEPSLTYGGMAANNSSGARSYAYGAARNHIQSLRVVLADGSILNLERGRERADGRKFSLTAENGKKFEGSLPSYSMPAVKNSAGYYSADNMDLIDLFIGSEGTLGIIAEMEIKIAKLPGAMWGICAFFGDDESALRFVREVKGLARQPVAIEYQDANSLDLLRREQERFAQYQKSTHLPEEWKANVYVEFHGENDDAVEPAVMAMSEKLTECGGDDEKTWMYTGWSEIINYKQIRHVMPEVINGYVGQRKAEHPGLTKLATDFAVPEGKLEEILALQRAGADENGLEHLAFGHISENNVHFNILPRNQAEYDLGKKLIKGWSAKVLEMGGSIAAEHGVGKLKAELLVDMYGPKGIEEMRAVKKVFDPDDILNPGNMFGGRK